MNSRPPSDDGTKCEQPPAGPESRGSRRVARFLCGMGYLMLLTWGLTCLFTLLFFASFFIGAGGVGPGWGGIADGFAAIGWIAACVIPSCTLLPLGLYAIRLSRQGGRGRITGQNLVLAFGLLFAGLGVVSFVVQLQSQQPFDQLAFGAFCVVVSAIMLIILHPKRGAVVTLVLVVTAVAITTFDVRRERAMRTRLESEVIIGDLDLRYGGGIAFASSGDVIALGRDVTDGQTVVARWDFLSGSQLGRSRLPQLQWPQQLKRGQWDVSSHGSIIAMPWVVEKGSNSQGLYVYDFVSKEEKTYCLENTEYSVDCCGLRLASQGESCAFASKWQGRIDLWDFADGRCRTWNVAEGSIEAAILAFDPQGEFLVIYFTFHLSGGKRASPQLGIWSLQESSAQRLWCIDMPQAYGIWVSDDGDRLFVVTNTSDTNSELLCIATATAKIISRHNLGKPIDAWEPGWCGMSTAADQLVIVRSSSTEIWDVNSGSREHTLPFGLDRRWGSNKSAIDVDRNRVATAQPEPPWRYPQNTSYHRPLWIWRRDLVPASKTDHP